MRNYVTQHAKGSILLLLLFLLGTVSPQAKAQTTGLTVTGTITSQGEPMPGVVVKIEGTTNASLTDLNGRYELKVPTTEAVLVVTYLGYRTQRIQVQGRSVINVNLLEEPKALDEIVVIGYGEVEKRDVTGAMSSISGEELEKANSIRADQALQGRVSGVQINTNNAAPGGSVDIVVRGRSSINADNAPLLVIDGMVDPDARLELINPNDIASIDILKDASATAIYGSRGANGVIIVTTKTGKTGKTSLEFNQFTSVNVVTERLALLNAQEHAELLLMRNDDSELIPDNIAEIGAGTDWQDVIFRDAVTQNYQLALRHGTDQTKVSLSISHADEDGVIKRSNFTRSTIRLNMDQKFSNSLKVGTRLNYAKTSGSLVKLNTPGGTGGGSITQAASRYSPIVPVFNAEGRYSGPLSPLVQMDNPLAAIDLQDDNNFENLVYGNLFADYQISKPLSFRSNLGFRADDRLEQRYRSRELYAALGSGEARVTNTRRTHLLWDNYFTYKQKIGQHRLNMMAGSTIEGREHKRNRITGIGFPNDELGYEGLAVAEQLSSYAEFRKSTMASFMGRVIYDFRDKYLLTTSFRADGSSKFAENNKWIFVPSMAFAWRLSEEEFLKDIDAIYDMKLRLGYGRVGKQAIAEYQSRASYFSQYNAYAFGRQPIPGVYPELVENPNLKWETTHQYDVGMDMSFFRGRVSTTFDFYYKVTDDLLWEKLLPTYTGYRSQIQNLGIVENKGFEFELSTVNTTRGLKWNSGFNFSVNRNKVISLGGDQLYQVRASGGSLQGFEVTGAIMPGAPLGSFYGFVFDGIYQNQAEVDALTQLGGTGRPGQVKYKDINGDGIITEADRTVIGDANPDFTFGITNDFKYKNFDLYFLVMGIQGNEVLNLNRVRLEDPGSVNNSLKTTMNYWRGEGTSNTIQRPGESVGQMSSRFVEDGSFIRLKNLTLGYNFPVAAGKVKVPFSKLRLYASATNLLTFTNYSGYDPETNSAVGEIGEGEIGAYGYDYGGFPIAKSYIFGVNLTF